jgi:hypothetical protein
MPLQFPSSASIGQTYFSGSSPTYVFNGEAWDVQSAGIASVTSASFSTSASFASSAVSSSFATTASSLSPATQYSYGVLAGDATLFGSGSNLTTWNIVASSGIAHTSGVFTLTANKTYRISFAIAGATFSITNTGFLVIELVNSTTLASISANNRAIIIPPTSTANESSQPFVQMIYTPSTNESIRVRCTNAGGTATLRANFSNIVIEELR